jgi:AcrR family transcriptional regulator
MARWQPDARGRLQEAAMTLFVERGYNDVTVEDIARKAGLTKRSFFNHFADKREVMFSSVDAFEERVLAELANAETNPDALDTAVSAFTRAAAPMEDFAELARARRALIDSSSELQERELMKLASTTAKVADALVARGVARREAMFVAQAATAVFTTAVEEWACRPEGGLAASIHRALGDLRAALGTEYRGASLVGSRSA